MKKLKQISGIFKKINKIVYLTICILMLTSCDDRVGERFTPKRPKWKVDRRPEKFTLYRYVSSFKTLHEVFGDYAEADPKLKELLKGEKKHTLFLPATNKFFDNLATEDRLKLDATKIHSSIYKEIIYYSIAEGIISPDQIKKGSKITTLQGEVVQFSPGGTINIDKNTPPLEIAGNAHKFKNGMIYHLHGVLLPPSIRKLRQASMGTVAEKILWDKEYAGLFRIIGIADKNVPKENKIATLLANRSTKLTLFAVSDKMFSIDINKLKPKPTLSKYISDNFSTPEDARKFVKRHILESRVIEGEELEKFPNHYKITMMSGDKIKIIKAKRPFPPSNPHGIRLGIDGSQNLEKSGVVHAMDADSGSGNGVLHKCTMIQKE